MKRKLTQQESDRIDEMKATVIGLVIAFVLLGCTLYSFIFQQ